MKRVEVILNLEEMLSTEWRCSDGGHGESGETMISVPFCFCPDFKAGDRVRVTVERLPAKRKGKRP